MNSTHSEITFSDDEALIVVDVQNDFCPGGSLTVAGGDEVVPVLNRYYRAAEVQGRPIIFTRDWHPVATKHFAAYGGKWPVHCVQYTQGAQFHQALLQSGHVVSKGMRASDDVYSGFEGFFDPDVPLHDGLYHLHIKRLKIGGLATDYCVKATILDALKLGYQVEVIHDACRVP